MLKTTLCYIEKDGKYLMLHRTKKENDLNKDKWIGLGGKFEEGETAEECLLREVKEETGLRLTEYAFRGVVRFVSDVWPAEDMYLYTATGFEGTLSECDEGELCWVPKDDVGKLPLWEGDHRIFEALEKYEFFNMTVEYTGEKLKGYSVVVP